MNKTLSVANVHVYVKYIQPFAYPALLHSAPPLCICQLIPESRISFILHNPLYIIFHSLQNNKKQNLLKPEKYCNIHHSFISNFCFPILLIVLLGANIAQEGWIPSLSIVVLGGHLFKMELMHNLCCRVCKTEEEKLFHLMMDLLGCKGGQGLQSQQIVRRGTLLGIIWWDWTRFSALCAIPYCCKGSEWP